MQTKDRIWEIDFIRGIAIILMIIFHFIYNLKEFYGYNINYTSGFWYYVGILAAILFMLTSGISSTFSKNNLKRGIKFLGLGMMLTLFTFFYNPEFYIKFGILHFLGVSIILYCFIRLISIKHILILSVLTIMLGKIVSSIEMNTSILFPIGLIDSGFSSLDYYPMIPWFGVFLLGVVIGKHFYSGKKSLFFISPKQGLISFLGIHSLLIYFIHQPILLVLQYFINST